MKFVVLGVSDLALAFARALLDSDCTLSALISMPAGARPNNSADIATFARAQSLRYEEIEDVNSIEGLSLLREYNPDYILCSWPKILKKEALRLPAKYCVGTHPTQLPFNRGRHPLHWLIAQGIRQTMLTFFRMDEGVDSGNILRQIPIEITPTDRIGDLISKVTAAAYDGTRWLCRHLADDPFYEGTKQKHRLANYWRKRTPYDVTLDFRMSAAAIVRTVLSFASPYPCANLVFGNQLYKVMDASIMRMDVTQEEELSRIEPGKIVGSEGRRLRVKAADELVELLLAADFSPELSRAMYIHPPAKYLVDWKQGLV